MVRDIVFFRYRFNANVDKNHRDDILFQMFVQYCNDLVDYE